jgi:hypothetical protein
MKKIFGLLSILILFITVCKQPNKPQKVRDVTDYFNSMPNSYGKQTVYEKNGEWFHESEKSNIINKVTVDLGKGYIHIYGYPGFSASKHVQVRLFFGEKNEPFLAYFHYSDGNNSFILYKIDDDEYLDVTSSAIPEIDYKVLFNENYDIKKFLTILKSNDLSLERLIEKYSVYDTSQNGALIYVSINFEFISEFDNLRQLYAKEMDEFFYNIKYKHYVLEWNSRVEKFKATNFNNDKYEYYH